MDVKLWAEVRTMATSAFLAKGKRQEMVLGLQVQGPLMTSAYEIRGPISFTNEFWKRHMK